MTLLLAGIAVVGWLSYFVARDEAAFHKRMSDYWHEAATKATDRWLSVIEEDGALIRAARSTGADTPTEEK